MSLKKYSHEEISKMSMIDLANLILLEEKKAINFKDIYEKIAKLKGFTQEEKHDNIAQFYTDLNINGHFMTTGSNMWGLKRWYPVEQIDEELTAAPKKRKKKATKKKKKAPKKEVFEPEEEELDIVDDDIEVLTDNFKDDDDDLDEDFDDDFDDLDDEESYDEDEESYDEEDGAGDDSKK